MDEARGGAKIVKNCLTILYTLSLLSEILFCNFWMKLVYLNFKYYFCVVLEEDGFGEKPFFHCFVAEDGQRGEGHHVRYLGDGQQVGQGGEGSQEGKG